jgi:hypothetical protein
MDWGDAMKELGLLLLLAALTAGQPQGEDAGHPTGQLPAVSAGLPGEGQASASTPSGPADGPCTGDASRLCENAGPSRASRTQCLRDHEEDLSEGCKALLAEPQQRRADAGEACGDDAVRLCPGVQPGRSNTGMLNCRRANADSLSDACRDAVDALPGKKREGAPPGV